MKSKLVAGALAGLGMLACLAGCSGSLRQGENSASVADPPASPLGFEVQANVVSVDPGSGTIQVLEDPGVTVRVDDGTTFKDSRDGLDSFSISDIQVGDRLKIKIPSRRSSLVASLVMRRSERDGVELEGTAENISMGDGTFTILDVLFATGDQTVYRDSSGDEISREEFFDALASDVPPEVSGTLKMDGSILAGEASLLY